MLESINYKPENIKIQDACTIGEMNQLCSIIAIFVNYCEKTLQNIHFVVKFVARICSIMPMSDTMLPRSW